MNSKCRWMSRTPGANERQATPNNGGPDPPTAHHAEAPLHEAPTEGAGRQTLTKRRKTPASSRRRRAPRTPCLGGAGQAGLTADVLRAAAPDRGAPGPGRRLCPQSLHSQVAPSSPRRVLVNLQHFPVLLGKTDNRRRGAERSQDGRRS